MGGTLTAFLDGVAMTGSFTSVTQGFLLEDDELCTNTSSGIKIKHFKYISYDFLGTLGTGCLIRPAALL